MMTKYYLWLLLIFRYSRSELTELIEQYETPENIYYAFKENRIITDREFIEKSERITLDEAEKLVDSIRKRGISIITREDSLYPEALLSLINPPLILFAKGNTALLKNKLVTVSGSKKITDYTIRTEEKACMQLCEEFTLVSSLIDGCEQLACLTAIKCGKGCIEVLPCGVEYEYPKNSRLLREQILLNGGCILSEYLPDTKTNSGSFLQRARISGAISKATIIFQAGINSKSLNIASNSPSVFFIPPNDVFDPNYAGAVKQIRKGAGIYLGTEDIKRVFEEGYTPNEVQITIERKKNTAVSEKEEKIIKAEPEARAKEKAPDESVELSEELFDTPVHFSVYKYILEKRTSVTFDEIFRGCDCDISELSEILLDLEISGHITASAGSRYSIAK
ncbi:MAG: DNA-processing protein DprA [Ruminiclostridium sp.]|nr:DNA-processing protein DprA [Ruminiclostridium sp.]